MKKCIGSSRLVSPCYYASWWSSAVGWWYVLCLNFVRWIMPEFRAQLFVVAVWMATSRRIWYCCLGPSTNWQLTKDWWMHRSKEWSDLAWKMWTARFHVHDWGLFLCASCVLKMLHPHVNLPMRIVTEVESVNCKVKSSVSSSLKQFAF